MADDLRKEAMKRTNKLLIALADNNGTLAHPLGFASLCFPL
jgi:hypothetical protein